MHAAGALSLPAARAGLGEGKARTEQPRHREYVPIKHEGRTTATLVVYPEVKDQAPVVVLIHEIFGLSDWMKLQADGLAAQGYIVVVPDLVSGLSANGKLFAAGFCWGAARLLRLQRTARI
ncbi:MAG TPA: dienelactone hydrolase family protein [Chthoniobacterales bacterium]